ncbi:hypothetical protein NDU88_004582 [Pleurodeles waltl]|uniref:Uncharacterized protein n=1 Tax=Pleurodeles waltl TaxID=8319 RepID=A0AAV7WYP9_PLEWA|nr:hypothetical protein NDU88_004582 [Pleurodeles waltl]
MPMFENHKITIYPEYTKKRQERPKSFFPVSQKWRVMQLKYMLLHPSKLKVISQASAYEVCKWLELWDSPSVRGWFNAAYASGRVARTDGGGDQHHAGLHAEKRPEHLIDTVTETLLADPAISNATVQKQMTMCGSGVCEMWTSYVVYPPGFRT